MAGASAYPRITDAKIFREIADEVGALLMVDMAQWSRYGGTASESGRGCAYRYHKRHIKRSGVRGGAILAKEEFEKAINKAIFPGTRAARSCTSSPQKLSVSMRRRNPSLLHFGKNVIENCAYLAEELMGRGFRLVSGGTDNHLMLINAQ